jgi:hypothetical protein
MGTTGALWARRVAACRLKALTQKNQEESGSVKAFFEPKLLEKNCFTFSGACVVLRGEYLLPFQPQNRDFLGLRAITCSQTLICSKWRVITAPAGKGRQLSDWSSMNYPPNRSVLAV